MNSTSLVFPLAKIGEQFEIQIDTPTTENTARRGARLSTADLNTEWTRQTLADYGLMEAEKLVSGHLFLQRTGNTVRVRGQIDLKPCIECSRCLARIRIPLHVELESYFLPSEDFLAKTSNHQQHEIELDESDLAVYEYKKDQINLEELIVDAIEAAIPTYPLCKDDCPGLSSHSLT